jgi:hypothetical protein
MSTKIHVKMEQQFVRYEQKIKWYRICHFFSDCAQYSHEKVMIVVDVLVWNMVEICCWVSLFEVSKILVYTLLFAFAFSYQQCTSSHDVLRANLYHPESKAL